MDHGAQNRKIGMLTFNNEVNIIGDGLQNPLVITGDKLNDFETLYKLG